VLLASLTGDAAHRENQAPARHNRNRSEARAVVRLNSAGDGGASRQACPTQNQAVSSRAGKKSDVGSTAVAL